MLDPSIWSSEDFNSLDTLGRLIWIGMISNADDVGIGPAKAVYLKSIIFPYDDCIRTADIDKALDDISAKMSVIFYAHNEREYYFLYKWKQWQKVDRPRPTTFPKLSDQSKILRNTAEALSAHNLTIRELIDD